MVPVLPVINLPPPRGLFLVIGFSPIVFYLPVWISLLVTTVIIRCTYCCYCRQINHSEEE